MNNKHLITMFTALASTLWGVSAAADPSVSSGEWEFEMTMESPPGMDFRLPPMRYRHCVSREKPVPEDPNRRGKQPRDCKTTLSPKGDDIVWTMHCENSRGTTDVNGTMRYRGNTMTADQTVTTRQGSGATQTSKMKMTGRRIGACRVSEK